MSRNSKNKPRGSYEKQELFDGYSPFLRRLSSKKISQNVDFSNFPLLCEKVYELLELDDPYLRRQMPYCVFLHAMNEYLNAYLLHYNRPDDLPASYMSPLSSIDPYTQLIPTPIYEYINGIGTVKTISGLEVHFNLPIGGTPQGPLEATDDEPAMESGSFGSCTAETHNSYECYVSPYVTRRLIERTLYANTTTDPDRFGDWSPLPEGRYPRNGIANRNLLGYQKPEILHNDSISFLINLHFHNGNTGLGFICHSNEVLTRVSLVLSFFSEKFHMSVAEFSPTHSYPPKSDPSALIYLNFEGVIPPGGRVAECLDTMMSPESFDETAANKANYFGYKKKRNLGSIGSCYTLDGEVPEGWEETRNNNFDMMGSFAPRPALEDMADLRDRDFLSHAIGCRDYEISRWLNRHFQKMA